MAELKEVHGIILPFTDDIIRNIVEKNKRLIAKFTTHVPSKKTVIRLKKGDVLFLYESGGSKRIKGRAIIKSINYFTPEEIKNKFTYSLAVPLIDFDNYTKNREDKKMMTFNLINPSYLKRKIHLPKQLTMAGQYVYNKHSIDNWV